MKKSDIAMIILIASICAGLSYAAVSAVPFLRAPDKPRQVPTIEQYSAEVATPDPNTFNKDAINPTVDVTIGGSSSDDE